MCDTCPHLCLETEQTGESASIEHSPLLCPRYPPLPASCCQHDVGRYQFFVPNAVLMAMLACLITLSIGKNCRATCLMTGYAQRCKAWTFSAGVGGRDAKNCAFA